MTLSLNLYQKIGAQNHKLVLRSPKRLCRVWGLSESFLSTPARRLGPTRAHPQMHISLTSVFVHTNALTQISRHERKKNMTATASKNPAQRPANRRRATIAASAALATVITGANLPATFGATAPIRNVATSPRRGAHASPPAPSVRRPPMARAGIVDAWLTSVRIPPGDPQPVAPLDR